MSCLHILEINPLLVPSFANIFSQSVGCLFILSMASFVVQELWSLIRSHLFIFVFISITLGEINGTPLQYSCLENPMDGEAWWAAVHGVAKSQMRLSDFTFTFHFSLSGIGKGNGNPLQCSCLENPRDRGDWWAAIYGVTQSRTRLKRLSSSSSSRDIQKIIAVVCVKENYAYVFC